VKRLPKVQKDTYDRTSYARALRSGSLIHYLNREKGMSPTDIATHLKLRRQDVERVLQSRDVRGLDVR